jgi:RimJ/RimL family protein N-acetyltransferase
VTDAGESRPDQPGDVSLRPVARSDLDTFFANQLDPEANRVAAFAAPDPTDREAFATHWAGLLSDDGVVVRTVLVDGRVAGHVLLFHHAGRPEVGYWIGRAHWGRGVASRALALFLRQVLTRPLYARVAKDNAASIRVLRKCGFEVTGEDRGYAHARGREVEEYVFTLAPDAGAGRPRASS